MTKVVHYII